MMLNVKLTVDRLGNGAGRITPHQAELLAAVDALHGRQQLDCDLPDVRQRTPHRPAVRPAHRRDAIGWSPPAASTCKKSSPPVSSSSRWRSRAAPASSSATASPVVLTGVPCGIVTDA